MTTTPMRVPPTSPSPAGTFTVGSHIEDHRSLVPHVADRLLPGPAAAPVGAVDAVVVPASRPAGNLAHAARVAAAAGAHLVVLASRRTRPAEAHAVAARHLRPERIVVVGSPGRWRIPGIELIADGLAVSRGRGCDTGVKRNLGLALARSCGWRRVLFLDDDVSGIGASHLGLIAATLRDGTGLEAVGWAFDDFPDNSMVCHAYRLAGGRQSTFVGGGALAVRVAPCTPHFPLVYNEDWLFMLPMILRQERTLAIAGNLTQEPFDPFARPADAVRQEFGDLLAEGLFRMVHENRDLSEAHDAAYWERMLALRVELIDRTARHLLRSAGENVREARAGDAVRALIRARSTLRRALTSDGAAGSSSWSRAIVEWVEAWRRDSLTWSDYLEGLPDDLEPDVALRRLDLLRHSGARGQEVKKTA